MNDLTLLLALSVLLATSAQGVRTLKAVAGAEWRDAATDGLGFALGLVLIAVWGLQLQ